MAGRFGGGMMGRFDEYSSPINTQIYLGVHTP